jgi:hypothetical protein
MSCVVKRDSNSLRALGKLDANTTNFCILLLMTVSGNLPLETVASRELYSWKQWPPGNLLPRTCSWKRWPLENFIPETVVSWESTPRNCGRLGTWLYGGNVIIARLTLEHLARLRT